MHIVVINRWPRFSDERRWDHELSRFEEFIDHDRHRISYVVDPVGETGVLADRSKIARLVKIEDVNDFEALCGAVREIEAEVGPVDQLVALSEFTLAIAAEVREALGIPGPRPEEVAVYRNKLRMKELVAKAGVRVPRFAPCGDAESAVAFARSVGYPLILKPVGGAASIGVHRVEDEPTLLSLLGTVDPEEYEIEEFIAGAIYHVDGFADDEARIPFQAVSRYVNDCLSYEAGGAPLGSVVLQASELRDRVEEFARTCVSALGMKSMPFHLEVFVSDSGELVFLEIAGRIGGAEVPYLTHRLFGVNLCQVWLNALCEGTVTLPPKTGDPSGGWLIIPKPEQLPARVISVTSLRDIPTVWRELVPSPGDVLAPGGSYDAVHSGRYILVGDEAAVEQDIRRIVDEFRIETEPVPE
ncbi:acetyl-CoA carboxylase biotin carboxylase subunit family protein [Streptomyces sp. TRM68367]|uniref:ATP-grasp domain-containing protein n=1 Tax=Streptomyces sp. TRM68367 TaxID=2758415 RepID=UPI00165C2C5D|nr:ATP-grasp domain-containing protein [Streptomyces sp. TRM68367]MBC9726542.1 ATP-grasp domain-containing protein [Streptomyces sp. TRM68367]